MLCGFRRVQKRSPHRLRRLDFDKAIGRVKIVFATFVNDAKVPFCCCIVVWNYLIDLVQFQRCRISTVVDAYREPL